MSLTKTNRVEDGLALRLPLSLLTSARDDCEMTAACRCCVLRQLCFVGGGRFAPLLLRGRGHCRTPIVEAVASRTTHADFFDAHALLLANEPARHYKAISKEGV